MTKLQSECLAEIWRHAVTLEAVSDKVVREVTRRATSIDWEQGRSN